MEYQEELTDSNKSFDGLNGFYTTIMENQNWGGYSKYEDMDDAIKDLFREYLQQWENVILLEKEKVQELKQKQREAKQKLLKLKKRNRKY